MGVQVVWNNAWAKNQGPMKSIRAMLADELTGTRGAGGRSTFTGDTGPTNRFVVVVGLAVLLGVMVLQLALSVRQESISWDEGDHLFSGYISLKHCDFGLNPEHPPMVKMVAALPLLHLHLDVPEVQKRNFKMEAFEDGKRFAAWNSAQDILFRARMAASVFTVLLGLLIFLAAREMFGAGAGWFALALFAFDPNFLAHGAMVTTDVGISCFLFAGVYAFYRYVKWPSLGRLLVAALATGLALAAKHTGILLFVMLLALAVLETLRTWFYVTPVGVGAGATAADAGQGASTRGPAFADPRRVAMRMFGSLAAITIIAALVLWWFYGFRYSARPAGMELNPSLATYLAAVSHPPVTQLVGAAARFKLLPESYLYGIVDIQGVNDFYSAYFWGKIYPHGSHWYFPGVLVVKSTLPFLILLVLAVYAIASGRMRKRFGGSRAIVFLTVPPAIYLIVAMSSHMNIGARHILPVYAFLYVLGAGAATAVAGARRPWFFVALVTLQIITTVHAAPDYMAYSNEVAGGPTKTQNYLSDSNTDWGQQLFAVKKYVDEHGIKDCWFVYFAQGAADFRDYGIPCKPLPTVDTAWWLNEELDVPAAIDGVVFVSESDRAGFEFGPGALNPYEQFRTMIPDATIQHGVHVYHGHFDIPLAAAYEHAQKSANFLAAQKFEDALAEAQQAVTLAPESVQANAAMGDALVQLGRRDEARPYYGKALALAETVEPEFQGGWIPDLEKKVGTN
jgi:hypothetical protein